jgi:hypothetical protein
MKLNRLETHDRLEHLIADQSISIAQGANDCLKANPLSLAMQDRSPYVYIFAHPRTSDDGLKKRMLWQPRLTKPKAQTNSYLFRAQSKTDILEICWLLPPEEMWPEYKKGNVTEHEYVLWSINQYKNNRQFLERNEPDDLPDEKIKSIYADIKQAAHMEKQMDKLYLAKNLLLEL